MKKLALSVLTITLAIAVITGCSRTSSDLEDRKPDAVLDAQAPDEAKEEVKDTSNEKDESLTLAKIRKAAEKAGYQITDEYNASFMKEVVDGFAVQIVADGEDCIYSVFECKTEDAAIQNAKDIDDAGYNISIRKGKIMTCYGTGKKEGTIKGILTSILEGNPVEYKEP